ncbi:hypothetical protein MPHO_07560 [Mycolicibacterium phocaicum]|uniref:Uncharacterized protein n=4 Tax=Mycobacteriaceae TaxID=1762 RepID=A0AA37UZP7_9MYCO|nr:hypothetical protein MAUB_63470 [Mycolicibacterium aubagnense]BBZ53764.1 hypothetical protein MPHO_07560 [Mycolicibacterium phocaicum]BBZ60671.1 hypothetical protein MMON_19720 [Mycolicibacterium monacense]GAT12714.1 uncharacterized protein RMCN_5847 [Mycolicibacterium novocastrense]GCB01184.1 hypothetical protein NCCNTM_48180 [Mycolicibacterium sp. NCC-Tsukiji]GLB86551.1 hypothetical protein SRL2020028_58070 [Mycobacterium kiyosense]
MPRAVTPMNPKWLRQNTNNIRIGIQRHQLVTFYPGLVTYMCAGCGEPPQPGKVTLTSKRGEIPHW